MRHVTSDSSPDCCGSEAAGNTATRISSSNHPCFRRYLPIFRSLRPVGSAQVGLGRPSVECGLVGCSWRWWNDYQNDQQCKLGWVQEERTAPTSRVGVGWRRSCEVEQVAHGSSVAEPCHGARSAKLISDTSSGHLAGDSDLSAEVGPSGLFRVSKPREPLRYMPFSQVTPDRRRRSKLLS